MVALVKVSITVGDNETEEGIVRGRMTPLFVSNNGFQRYICCQKGVVSSEIIKMD